MKPHPYDFCTLTLTRVMSSKANNFQCHVIVILYKVCIKYANRYVLLETRETKF